MNQEPLTITIMLLAILSHEFIISAMQVFGNYSTTPFRYSM